MTADETIFARERLQKSKAEADAYRQGVDDGYDAGRNEAGFVPLIVGIAFGAGIVAAWWVISIAIGT